MYGHATLQIWQCEVRLAVAAISRAQDGKQGLVLINGQELPVARSPSLGRKIESEHPYFTDKWF
jgi:hypothetical protein